MSPARQIIVRYVFTLPLLALGLLAWAKAIPPWPIFV